MAEGLRLSPVAQAMGEAGLRRQLDVRYGRTRLLSRIQLRDYLEAHERTMYERFISAKARRLGLTRATLHLGAGDEFLAARGDRGVVTVGVDPARPGSDRTAYAYRNEDGTFSLCEPDRPVAD